MSRKRCMLASLVINAAAILGVAAMPGMAQSVGDTQSKTIDGGNQTQVQGRLKVTYHSYSVQHLH
ncbi:MAG: hypothetical protein KGR26_01410 [Cyanobacteria bacterium REEB65]|nr:hypothetical protein [Cyanobacteria bacterium REEB65]